MVSIPVGSSLGRYRVIEQLGQGGMATVFRCHDPNLDRYVAVKVLPSYHQEDPTFVGRFAQEAQTIAKLSHPNILQVFDFGEDKGFSFIVTELVGGGDLQDRLKGEPLGGQETLKWMGPLAGALDFAHARGIVHRDIKPANVLISDDDRPILADFGLARMLESAIRFTQAQQALGTPEYMAPEQAMGADADHRTDLYALGVMIYQMLVGQTPYRADTPAATLMAHVHKPLPLPTALNPSIEPRLEATMLKALAKDPDDRFQSARELVQAIALGAGQPSDDAAMEEIGATVVLDTADLEADAMEAATAVMGTAAPAAPGEAAAAPAEAAPAPKRKLSIALAGAAAVAVLAVVAVVVVFASQGETPEVPVTVPPVAAVPEAPPTPVMSAAEAVAALNEVIGRSSSNAADMTDELKNNINIDFKTRDELETLTRGFYKRGALRDQIFGAEELYKALGMMDQNADLEQILLDIQLQQVFALYDDVSGNLYVISEAAGLGPVEELGIAAAYMSGIQEQLFSVSTLRQQASDANSDQYRAVTALQVGDVTEVAKAYISREFTLEDGAEIAKPIPGNKLLTAPAVVQAANRFPGLEGSRFISELYSTEGSWDGVNAAYQSPPISTEQIIHPDKYFEGEEPQRTTIPNIADKLGRGWEQVGSNVMGEFLIRTYLEEELDQKQAAAAAAGWGGDRYSVLRGPQAERVFLSMTAWDDFQEADEFFEAYKTFATIKTTQAEGNSEAVGESGRKWVMKDQTIFAGQIGPVVMLVIGNTEELVSTALSLLFEALEQQETTPP